MKSGTTKAACPILVYSLCYVVMAQKTVSYSILYNSTDETFSSFFWYHILTVKTWPFKNVSTARYLTQLQYYSCVIQRPFDRCHKILFFQAMQLSGQVGRQAGKVSPLVPVASSNNGSILHKIAIQSILSEQYRTDQTQRRPDQTQLMASLNKACVQKNL